MAGTTEGHQVVTVAVKFLLRLHIILTAMRAAPTNTRFSEEQLERMKRMCDSLGSFLARIILEQFNIEGM